MTIIMLTNLLIFFSCRQHLSVIYTQSEVIVHLFLYIFHLVEYDKYVETHKADLLEKVASDDMTEAEVDLQELEIEEADQEVQLRKHIVKIRYKQGLIEL